jgi:hypothetical protein
MGKSICNDSEGSVFSFGDNIFEFGDDLFKSWNITED